MRHPELDAIIRRYTGNDATSSAEIAPFAVIRPTTLEGVPVPERRWVVPGWIPHAEVTGLGGRGGIGKSLLAQELLTSVALGRTWLGLPVARARVVYFACEDSGDELHRRQAAINKTAPYDCSFADLEDILWIARRFHENVLATFEFAGSMALTPTFNSLMHEARQFGAQLIVIDTLADVFGGNEISRIQARQFVQECLGALVRELDTAVVVLYHPSQAGQNTRTGESGSTGWDAAFRSRAYLSEPVRQNNDWHDPDLRELTRKKANYATRDDRILLRWVDGVLMLENTQAGGDIADRYKAERVFKHLLAQRNKQRRWVSDKSRAGNYAPREFARMEDREALGQADFSRAMEALFKHGEIVNEKYGKPSDGTCRIALADDAARC
jgi:RecA-family ATPase